MLPSTRSWLLVTAFLATPALAEDGPLSVFTRASTPEAPRNYVNLRLGGSTSSTRPELCGEVSPHWRFSVEGCGSGREFLHNEPIPEIAHIRAKFTFTQLKLAVGWLEPRAALGFAEFQLGVDDGGFDFFGVNRTATSTSGPEAGASLRWFVPLPAGIDFLMELNLSVAAFPFAPKLIPAQNVVQPSAGLSAGVGF
jgi:hypothetical protein